MVLPSGSLCLLLYLLALLYKLVHLVMTLVCPVGLSKMKKRWKGLPYGEGYDQYCEEFLEADFDLECPPPFYSVQGNVIIYKAEADIESGSDICVQR